MADGPAHYPKPIVDIELFKHDDFTLFVTDDDGQTVAVTPVGRRGSGDGRVALVWSPTPTTAAAASTTRKRTILPAGSTLARQAFAAQS